MTTDLIIFDPDARGLPPKRAKPAKQVAQRKRETEALQKLIAGQQKLAERITKAEAAADRESAAIDAEAASVVEQIKRGFDWALSTRKRKAVALDVEVERQAAVQLAAAIEFKQAEIADLDRLIADGLDAALVEQAATIGADYQAALEAARAAAVKLEGLSVALGNGRPARLIIEAPGFAVCGHDIDTTVVASAPMDVAAAADSFGNLRAVWLADPSALPGRHLKFAAPASDPLANITYESLTAAERRQADLRFSVNA